MYSTNVSVAGIQYLKQLIHGHDSSWLIKNTGVFPLTINPKPIAHTPTAWLFNTLVGWSRSFPGTGTTSKNLTQKKPHRRPTTCHVKS